MNEEFLINEANRVAKIINHSVGAFQNLVTLQERFEKELQPYKIKETRSLLLFKLKEELHKIFIAHITKCNKINSCPTHLTFRNINFLIEQELKANCINQEKLTKPELLDGESIIKKEAKGKKRPAIPYKIKAFLQKQINSICPFCSNDEVEHFVIHHIDENPENNDKSNLIMLCPICHSKITKGDIIKEIVVYKKHSITLLKSNL